MDTGRAGHDARQGRRTDTRENGQGRAQPLKRPRDIAGACSLFVACLLLLVVAGCACRGISRTVSDLPVRKVQVNGAELGVRTMGEGPALLLIMGYAGTMDGWDPELVRTLAREHRVILFDNRGMGYSGLTDAPYTWRQLASDAAGVLGALEIEKADVLGWSMGSIIAQYMALQHPDRVGRLVLYGTAHEAGPVVRAVERMGAMTPEEFMASLFPPQWLAEHPDVFSRLPVPAIAPDPAVVALQRAMLFSWTGTTGQLGAIRSEVLLVVGEEDDVTPAGQSLEMARLLPKSWLVRFRQGGHWLMHQQPQRLGNVVNVFLEGGR